ncbi:MAG: cupin domain-containing protein [Bacteroidota bacterium]
MTIAEEYIKSGIVEMYVLGMTNAEETAEVNRMAETYAEIRQEIKEITNALQIDAERNDARPSETLKPFIMAIVDYSERLKAGEPVTNPPLLTETSSMQDYLEWTSRPDMVLPDDFENLHAKIIGHNAEAITAISWVKSYSPPEVHTNELERFLILEGSCDITIGDKKHSLVAGDFLAIPLHVVHSLVVTSDIPCKVILQRQAA